jgi:hypothetical protein
VSQDSLRLHLFEQVADGLHSLVPESVGPWRQRSQRYGIKVWLGAAATPERLHFEAQVMGPKLVPEASALAVEIGFHAEHPDPDVNRAALARFVADERRWRRALGPEPVAGPFLGRARDWTRVSETWPDPDLGDPDLPFELATRLCDYLVALGPRLRDENVKTVTRR